jgi:hypothetical protein
MEGKGGGSTQSFRPLMEEVMVGYSKKKKVFCPTICILSFFYLRLHHKQNSMKNFKYKNQINELLKVGMNYLRCISLKESMLIALLHSKMKRIIINR